MSTSEKEKKKYIKKCSVCKKKFVCTNRKKLYCSEKCAKKAVNVRQKEKQKEWNILYRQSHREEMREHQRKYYKKNIEKERERARMYYRRNIKKRKEYYKKNRKKIISHNVKRRREDPMKRLDRNISFFILRSLKSRGISKRRRHWEYLVGWTRGEVKDHLEKLFRHGMSWKNYGKKWQIDHIIPKAFFEFKSVSDVEFKMCWRLKNLQPLWSKDNLRKNSKMVLWGKEIDAKFLTK